MKKKTKKSRKSIRNAHTYMYTHVHIHPCTHIKLRIQNYSTQARINRVKKYPNKEL